jgi:hypothetical protein
MRRYIVFVSACVSCIGLWAFGALADEVPVKPSDALKAPIDGKTKPSAETPAGLVTTVGEPKLSLQRARLFSFYAQTDEAPEIASVRADGSLHLAKGVTVEEAADVAASQFQTEYSDLCRFASTANVKQAYTILMNGKNMSWKVGLTVEGGVEFQKPNLTYREIKFFHLLASRLTCSATQSAKMK